MINDNYNDDGMNVTLVSFQPRFAYIHAKLCKETINLVPSKNIVSPHIFDSLCLIIPFTELQRQRFVPWNSHHIHLMCKFVL